MDAQVGSWRRFRWQNKDKSLDIEFGCDDVQTQQVVMFWEIFNWMFEKKETLRFVLLKVPYYLGYKAMALYPIQGQGHPMPYNGYKAMAL